jgi:hypothetical protein
VSSISVPKILVPLVITDAMLISSTIAEPDTGEVAWVSGGSYVASDIRIRTATHRKYLAIATHSGITTPPEDDPTHWKDVGATNKFAMFDTRRTTMSTDVTSISDVLQVGFFNALSVYLAEGSTLTVLVKDEPGGNVILDETRSLVGPFIDEWDYCWGPHRANTKQVFSGITPYPEAEITLTIEAATGADVGIGMVCIGDLRPLILGDWGGVEGGASATPVSGSYIKTDEFGDTAIIKRASATDMQLSIKLPKDSADYALACIQEVLDVPAAVIATEVQGYAGLNVFGLLSGPVIYEGTTYATIKANVKGLF